ncbi:MAG: hypothetical protein HY452_02245 [Parcubacteria group bacterium]|nr:hypothetical protein [Parcubacteria group bacterium]
MTVIKAKDVADADHLQKIRADKPQEGIVDCSGKNHKPNRRPPQTRKKRGHWNVVV